MPLTEYNRKRNFKATSEPAGKHSEKNQFRFVVQRHHASRLHYDFRLELDGVLKSWAIPKGPSLNPVEKRLAMMVEDHPVTYIDFEGEIPQGNYGAGIVNVWDFGTYTPVNENHEEITDRQALKALKQGQLKFSLNGGKLKGEFVLVQLKKADKNNSWLLIKHRDVYAVNEAYNSEEHIKQKKKERASTKKNDKKQTAKHASEENKNEKPVPLSSGKSETDNNDTTIIIDKHKVFLTNLKNLLASASRKA